ncbi:YCF48-related protein [Zunongwangia sp.]|uniref:YCF48-related protein n=1 Tax=Zunongwangia sp. TaxID=1965325 RepID=UPI003AA8BE72
MNNFKIVSLLFCCVCFIKCNSQTHYKPVSDFPEIEIDTNTVNFTDQEHFQNKVTGKTVKVLHSVENTGFHFYNSVSFKNEKTGIIVGGTRLRISSTQDGGQHWKSFSFSGFANAFYCTTIYNNQFFVVGASRFIFRNKNLDKEWEVFDVSSLSKNNYGLRYPKFYKIKFSESGLGFIIGDNSGNPILLKTTNGGKNWQLNPLNGLKKDDNSLSDLFILPDNTILIITFKGNVYQSENGGNNWLLLRSGKQGESLNSIAFKNKKEGYISGLQSLLLKTKDGGKTWHKIDTSVLGPDANISNLEYTKNNQLLLTTAESFQNHKYITFVFSVDQEENISPFLLKKEKTFTGDAYGLFILKNKLFVLDRDKLYKTSL